MKSWLVVLSRSGIAFLPTDVNNLLEAGVNGVIGQLANSCGVSAGQSDLRVDIHSAVLTAGGPDNRSYICLIVQQIVFIQWPRPRSLRTSLWSDEQLGYQRTVEGLLRTCAVWPEK